MEQMQAYLQKNGMEWQKKKMLSQEKFENEILQEVQNVSKEDFLRNKVHTYRMLDFLFEAYGQGVVMDQKKFIQFLGMPEIKWLLPEKIITSMEFVYWETEKNFHFVYEMTSDTEILESHLRERDKKYSLIRAFRQDRWDFYHQTEKFKLEIVEWLEDWEKRYNFVRTLQKEMMEFIWEDIQQIKKRKNN